MLNASGSQTASALIKFPNHPVLFVGAPTTSDVSGTVDR